MKWVPLCGSLNILWHCLRDWNENWPFPVCGHSCVFQICWYIECSTFRASSSGIWNSSTGIPSPPLALFVVMLPKAHLTSHSRMSGSRWVIIPSWLSGLCVFLKNTLEMFKKLYINIVEFYVKVKVTQLCPTLCHPTDCSPPGSSVQGIHQARILEWVPIPFSRGSSWPKDRTQVSCTAGRFFTVWLIWLKSWLLQWPIRNSIISCCIYFRRCAWSLNHLRTEILKVTFQRKKSFISYSY